MRNAPVPTALRTNFPIIARAAAVGAFEHAQAKVDEAYRAQGAVEGVACARRLGGFELCAGQRREKHVGEA